MLTDVTISFSAYMPATIFFRCFFFLISLQLKVVYARARSCNKLHEEFYSISNMCRVGSKVLLPKENCINKSYQLLYPPPSLFKLSSLRDKALDLFDKKWYIQYLNVSVFSPDQHK